MAGIDRDYWLDFAKDSIAKSIESREKAAERLDTFLIWIWGIYTSVFALASLFNFMSGNICQLILVAQPILIIMLSRFFCAMVSMPSTNKDNNMRADPNDVASIIDSFQIIVRKKKIKLRIAIIFTLISIISISGALVSYNFFDPNKQLKGDIQTAKLKKELHDQSVPPPKSQLLLNDSIKSINDYYDLQSQNIIKTAKLNCIKNSDQKCLETLKLLDK